MSRKKYEMLMKCIRSNPIYGVRGKDFKIDWKKQNVWK